MAPQAMLEFTPLVLLAVRWSAGRFGTVMRSVMRPESGLPTEQIARRIERTRDALARKWRGTDEVRNRLLDLTLGEAAAVAWDSGVPHLVFPTLAMEKVAALNRWWAKQDRIRRGRLTDVPAERIQQLAE